VDWVPERLSKAGVREYAVAELAKPQVEGHSLSDLADHIASRTSNEGGTKDFIRSFTTMDLVDASSALTEGTIASIKEFGVSLILDAIGLEAHFIVAD